MRKYLMLPLVLAACTAAPVTGPGSGPDPVEPAGACGAGNYAGLVGGNVAATTFPADLWFWVLYPDTLVTQEFEPERLNLRVDADGTILQVYCG